MISSKYWYELWDKVTEGKANEKEKEEFDKLVQLANEGRLIIKN